MSTKRILFAVIVSALALTGCASGEQALIEAGAMKLSQDEIVSLFRGNTAMGDGWNVYYNEDGRKLVKVGGKITERKWWISSEGDWCDTLYRTGQELCGPKIYKHASGYAVITQGGKRLDFTVAPGNPMGMI